MTCEAHDIWYPSEGITDLLLQPLPHVRRSGNHGGQEGHLIPHFLESGSRIGAGSLFAPPLPRSAPSFWTAPPYLCIYDLIYIYSFEIYFVSVKRLLPDAGYSIGWRAIFSTRTTFCSRRPHYFTCAASVWIDTSLSLIRSDMKDEWLNAEPDSLCSPFGQPRHVCHIFQYILVCIRPTLNVTNSQPTPTNVPLRYAHCGDCPSVVR